MSKLIYHPQSMYKSNINDLVEDLFKGGEGSRGGKVIGHTKSGKPIYDSAMHVSHKNFSKEDHYDGVKAHKKAVYSKIDEINKQTSKDSKVTTKLKSEIESHYNEICEHDNQRADDTIGRDNSGKQISKPFEGKKEYKTTLSSKQEAHNTSDPTGEKRKLRRKELGYKD